MSIEPTAAPANPAADPRAYWCFVSYRHADNREEGRQWATWLQYQLETYEVPPDLVGTTNERGETIPAAIFPVFRDEEELSTGDLAARIHHALDHSRILVVLCSPRSAASAHVDREIRYFKSRRDATTCARTIHALIIEGDPAERGDPASRCFPDALRHPVVDGRLDLEQTVEPLAADLRLPDGSQGWTSPEAFRRELQARGELSAEEIDRLVNACRERSANAVLRLIAGVLGVPYGVLRERDKAYQLKRARIEGAHQASHLARALHDSDPVAALRHALQAVSVLEAEDPASLPSVLGRIAPVLRSGRWARIGENVERVLPTANGRCIVVVHADTTVECLGVRDLKARARYREVRDLSEAWGPDGAWRILVAGRRSVLIDMRTGRRGLRPFPSYTRFVPPGKEDWWRPLARYNQPRGQCSASLGWCFVRSMNDDDEWGAVDSFVDRVDLRAGRVSPADDVYELVSNDRAGLPAAVMRENQGWFLHTPAECVNVGGKNTVANARFSPAGAFAVITLDHEPGVRVYSCATGRPVLELPAGEAGAARLAFSADDALVLLHDDRGCRILSVPAFQEVARLEGDFREVSVEAVAGVPAAWTLSSAGGERILVHTGRGPVDRVRDIDPGGRLAVLEGDDPVLLDVAAGTRTQLDSARVVFSPHPAARLFATEHADPDAAAKGPARIDVRAIDDPDQAICSTKRPGWGEAQIGVENAGPFTVVWSFERETNPDPPFQESDRSSTEVFDVTTGRRVARLSFAVREARQSRGDRPALTFLRGEGEGFAILHNGRREQLWTHGYGDPAVERVETGAASHHDVFVLVHARAPGAVHRMHDGKRLAVLSGVVTRVEFDAGKSGVLAVWYRDGRTELWRAGSSGAVRLADLGLIVSDVHLVGREPWAVVRHADGRAYLLSTRWLSAVADPGLPVERLMETVRTHTHSPIRAAWWAAGHPQHHPHPAARASTGAAGT